MRTDSNGEESAAPESLQRLQSLSAADQSRSAQTRAERERLAPVSRSWARIYKGYPYPEPVKDERIDEYRAWLEHYAGSIADFGKAAVAAGLRENIVRLASDDVHLMFGYDLLKAGVDGGRRAVLELLRAAPRDQYRWYEVTFNRDPPGEIFREPSEPADLVTKQEMMALVNVQKRRWDNVVSGARTAGEIDVPSPVIEQTDDTPAKYSYRASRQFLLRHWPHRELRLPESLEEAKRILAASQVSTE